MTQDEEGRAPATIAVTQADRGRAADLAAMERKHSFMWREAPSIRAGRCDNWEIVQAFACHRTEAQAKLREAGQRLITVFDQQRMTTAERIIVGVSDAGLRTEGNAAIEAIRVALRDTQP